MLTAQDIISNLNQGKYKPQESVRQQAIYFMWFKRKYICVRLEKYGATTDVTFLSSYDEGWYKEVFKSPELIRIPICEEWVIRSGLADTEGLEKLSYLDELREEQATSLALHGVVVNDLEKYRQG